MKPFSWLIYFRQVSNFIERLVLLAPRPVLDVADVAAALAVRTPEPGPAPVGRAAEPAWRPYLKASSHAPEDLREALARAGGNKSRAAQLLGLTERQFAYRWRKQMGGG